MILEVKKRRSDELANEINPNDKDIINDIALFLTILFFALIIQYGSAQRTLNPLNVNQQSVTHQKQSNFIHEFDVPVDNQIELKDITTDSGGNPWFYHQTNKTSTIMKYNFANSSFSSHPVEGKTVTERERRMIAIP